MLWDCGTTLEYYLSIASTFKESTARRACETHPLLPERIESSQVLANVMVARAVPLASCQTVLQPSLPKKPIFSIKEYSLNHIGILNMI